MVISIVVTLQFDGIHCWPECPIEEVSFLRDPHRHLFKVECKKLVSHSDRDVEIIQLKHEILEYLKNTYWVEEKRSHILGRRSCEDVAIQLTNQFNLSYCKVLEDGENGAEVIA